MKTEVLLFSLVLLAGCRESEPTDPIPYQAAKSVRFDPTSIHVYQPVPGQRYAPTSSVPVSFDTQTGQICRTYDWGRGDTAIPACEMIERMERVMPSGQP